MERKPFSLELGPPGGGRRGNTMRCFKSAGVSVSTHPGEAVVAGFLGFLSLGMLIILARVTNSGSLTASPDSYTRLVEFVHFKELHININVPFNASVP